MKILNHRQIEQKIQRLAIEIIEHNFNESSIILAGINNNGLGFARMLLAALERHQLLDARLTKIQLNPANPLDAPISIGMDASELRDQVVVVVDDVANTGRTLFYAFQPLLLSLPKRVEVAVLVDRQHKSFPVNVDYKGLSLATTLRENIDVQIRDVDEYAVYLN